MAPESRDSLRPPLTPPLVSPQEVAQTPLLLGRGLCTLRKQPLLGDSAGKRSSFPGAQAGSPPAGPPPLPPPGLPAHCPCCSPTPDGGLRPGSLPEHARQAHTPWGDRETQGAPHGSTAVFSGPADPAHTSLVSTCTRVPALSLRHRVDTGSERGEETPRSKATGPKHVLPVRQQRAECRVTATGVRGGTLRKCRRDVHWPWSPQSKDSHPDAGGNANLLYKRLICSVPSGV